MKEIIHNMKTKVYEITPRYRHKYENSLKSRYSNICKIIGCDYYSMEADPIEIENLDENTKKFINMNIINQSNY